MNRSVQDVLLSLAPLLLPWVRRGLFSSCRFRFVNARVRDEFIVPARPFVAVLWHQYILMGLQCVARRKIVLMSSQSRDGEFSTRLLEREGHRVVRGSSSAGGARALLGLTRIVREGYGALMIADGPRGPARTAKLGCLMAAGRAGAPVIPVGCALSRAAYLGNWDRTAVPCPGSRIVMGWGEPLHVPPDAPREEYEPLRVRLDSAMAAVEAQCREAMRSWTR